MSTHKVHGLVDHTTIAGKTIVRTRLVNRGLLRLEFADRTAVQVSADDDRFIEIAEIEPATRLELATEGMSSTDYERMVKGFVDNGKVLTPESITEWRTGRIIDR